MEIMKEEELLRLLEGHEDILTPAATEMNRRFENKRCSQCGGKMVKHLDPSQPFLAGALLANYQAKCVGCDRIEPA